MLKIYSDYLTLAPSGRTSSTDFSEIHEDVSHDKLQRWLANSNYSVADLWNEVKGGVDLERGYLVLDETFRILKQAYHLSDCQARRAEVWATHIFACLLTFVKRQVIGLNHYAEQTKIHQRNLRNALRA